jgi:protein phosphatase
MMGVNSMKIKVAYYTGIGNTRENNEDSILIYDDVHSKSDFENFKIRDIDLDEGFFSVADGLGGHAGGEIASGTVLNFMKNKRVAGIRELKKLFYLANSRLDNMASEQRELYGMGTVLTGVYLKEDKAIIFNIGDSRTYLMREKLKRMTDDHSLVWELMKKEKFENEGEMHDWIRRHPRKNIITSALIAGAGEFESFLEEIAVKKRDKFFITSDGVWEELSFSEIETSLSKGLNKAAELILKKCKARGKDNISFVIVEIINV